MQKKRTSPTATFGGMLKAARKAKRLSLREVGAAANVSHGYIADLEEGRRSALNEVVERLARAVGIEPRILQRAANIERLQKLEARAAELRRATR